MGDLEGDLPVESSADILRTGCKVPLKYGLEDPALRAQEIRSRNRGAQARYRLRQRALKRTKESQEKSLQENVSLLQSDNAFLADKKAQLETILWQLCRQVKGVSQPHSALNTSAFASPAKASTLDRALIDDATTFRPFCSLSREQVLSSSMNDFAAYLKDIMMRLHKALSSRQGDAAIQAAVEQYLLLCCALKDHRPDMLRQLEDCNLETCAPLQDRDHAEAKTMWTTIMNVAQLSLHQKQMSLELRRGYVNRTVSGMRQQLLQATEAMSSSPGSLHRNVSELLLSQKEESEAYHSLQSSILTEVLSHRQSALWIVLAWPRMCDLMALLDIAAQDVEIARCFSASVNPIASAIPNAFVSPQMQKMRSCDIESCNSMTLPTSCQISPAHASSPATQYSGNSVTRCEQYLGPFSRQGSLQPRSHASSLLEELPADGPSQPMASLESFSSYMNMSPGPNCSTPAPAALNAFLRDLVSWS